MSDHSVKVENYSIFLNIDSKNRSYSATENIELSVAEKSLKLDSVDLEIKYVRQNGKDLKYKVQSNDGLSIELLEAGETNIEIGFNGKIPELLTGLYLSKAVNGDFFTTQFESTGARRMFPCLDNPSYKATFEVSVEVERDLEAISNMPVDIEKVEGDRKKVTFRRTPRMSTYLLYLGVGKFDSKSLRRKGTDVILTAPKGQLTSSDFPLEIASQVLDEFEDYFDIDYVLPKVHLISVPDFGAGAMENWGAITFREIFLGIDKSTSSSVFKATGAVIAHELAHQWFGDLVTMEWWNDLWLNESFATFMAYKILTKIHPDWGTIGDLVQMRTLGALKSDSLESSHPIDAEVKSPDDIAQIFDEISYGKGASILRMIEGYVGETNFRDGIRKYLKDHMYGNAKGSDLWSSIEQVSGMPVSKVMEAWIKTKGYPVVNEFRKNGNYALSQEQFLLSGLKTDRIWPVPLTYYENGTVKSELLETREMVLETKKHVKLNSNFSGFYRTTYDQETMEEILSESSRYTNLDLLGLLNDTYNMMLSGRLGRDTFISVIRKLWDSEDPMVINEIAGQLHSLSLITPESVKLRELASEYCSQHLERLGSKKKNEPINVSVARGILMSNLATLDKEFAEKQAGKFSNYFNLDSDERSSVALSFAVNGGKFNELESTLFNSRTDEDRTKLLSAMGWLQSESDLEKSLSLIRDGKVKNQDMVRFYSSASASPNSRNFMFRNMDFAVSRMREVFVGTGSTNRFLQITTPLLGINRVEEMKTFLENIDGADVAMGVKKSLEFLEVNSRTHELFSAF